MENNIDDALAEPLLQEDSHEEDILQAAAAAAAAAAVAEDDNDYVLIGVEDDTYILDPQRYAVLLVFGFANLVASAAWITFAPIEDAMQIKYDGITAAQVNWLSMIFMALYGPGTFICSWSIRRFSLRTTVVLSAWIMALGCILRWWSISFVSSNTTAAGSDTMALSTALNNKEGRNSNMGYILLLTGQGLVAIAQPVFANAPARVAAAWFQTTTQAVGVAVFMATIGMVLGQSMSPLFVHEATGDGLGWLLAGQAVTMVLCSLATWWYFQSEPKHPPSAAEAARRRCQTCSNDQLRALSVETLETSNELLQQDITDNNTDAIWKDVKTLLTDKQYIIMLVAFGIGYGANNATLTLLQPWIAAAGFPGDETAGLLGSLSIAGGVVGTMIAAPLLDASRNYNQAVRWSYVVAFLVAIGVVGTLRPSCPTWMLAVSFTAMGASQLPLLTICLDAAAAHSYPIPEELSSAGLQLVGQYLGIGMIDVMQSLLATQQADKDGSGGTHPVPQDAIGFKGHFNIAFLVLQGLSAAVALGYHGDDPRATAANPVVSNEGGANNNDTEQQLTMDAQE